MKPIKTMDNSNSNDYLDPEEFEPIVVDYDKKKITAKRLDLENLVEDLAGLKKNGTSNEEIISTVKVKDKKADDKLIDNAIFEDRKTIKNLFGSEKDCYKRQNNSGLRAKLKRIKSFLFKPIKSPSKITYEIDKSRIALKRNELESLVERLNSSRQEDTDNSYQVKIIDMKDSDPLDYMI